MRAAGRVLATVLVIAMSAGGAARAAEGAAADLSTPEGAVLEYLAGVAEADVARVLGASAIDEMSDGFRFELAIDRLKAFVPYSLLAPADDPFFADINRARQSDQLLGKVLLLTYDLLSDTPMDGDIIAPADRAWAETFQSQIDPSRLGDLEVLDVRFPDSDYERHERYLEDAAKQAATYGADELTERLALFDFEGQTYDVGFTLLRYGDTWKVANQFSPLSGMTSLGTARATTVEEYEALTSGGDD